MIDKTKPFVKANYVITKEGHIIFSITEQGGFDNRYTLATSYISNNAERVDCVIRSRSHLSIECGYDYFNLYLLGENSPPSGDIMIRKVTNIPEQYDLINIIKFCLLSATNNNYELKQCHMIY